MQSIWPLTVNQRPLRRLLDAVARRMHFMPGYCNICANLTVFHTRHPNFREHVRCLRCGSVNRHRQIAAVMLSTLHGTGTTASWFASLRRLPPNLSVWTAETPRAVQARLKDRLGANCISSEYLDAGLVSGQEVKGVLHVDIQRTHFLDNSLDYILTSDVMEHVPHPESALKETYRILKPGGYHIFTAPFYHHRFTNEVRSEYNADGSLKHHRQPWYHDDPLRPQGVLAYTVFAPELLCQIEKIGFEAQLLRLHSPLHGIYGQNGLVIVARKVIPPNHARDWIFPDAAK